MGRGVRRKFGKYFALFVLPLLIHLLQVVLQADARYRQDAEVADWVSQATGLLDSYTRAEWLPWGEPVGLLPITLQRNQECKRRAARQREVREA